MQIKESEMNNKSRANQASNIPNYEKQILSLEATIKTKESEMGFLKKQLENSTS
jgi:flagellar biosynthesis chaperone FliJ